MPCTIRRDPLDNARDPPGALSVLLWVHVHAGKNASTTKAQLIVFSLILLKAMSLMEMFRT